MRITALSKFCDGLMEACWLAALIITPAFYNIFSSRIFEPDKIALLRTLALIVLAAWAIKAGEAHSWKFPSLRPWREWTFQRLPLFWPVVLLVAANLLATLLSLTPRVSIWGSYDRGQGLYTFLAYLTFFVVIAVNLRHRDQIERLLSTLILTAFAVSAYGLVQKLNLDPMPWDVQTATRISGNLGNAIFFAAYLILAVPFTALRFIQATIALIHREPSPRRNTLNALLYIVILLTQLIAIYYSGSRGPWLGLLAGVLVAALLASLLLNRRAITIALLALAVLGLALIGLLNIPDGPLQSLRTNAYLGRLGHVFEDEDGTSRVRVLIWQGAAQMALPHDPLTYPDNSPDALNLIRPLVGYGPESTFVAFQHFYAPEIAHYEKRDANPDRSHNATFDALITTGLLGLLAYLAVFAAVIYLGLTWLGLLTAKDLWPYLACFVLGGLVGAIGLIIWRGSAYFGVGLPLGALLGLVIYIAILALTRTLPPINPWRASLLIALLAALIAHFVEVQFGIPIAATQLYNWVYVGLLISVGWAMRPANEPVKSKTLAEVPSSTRWVRDSIFATVVVSLLLITLTYGFLTAQSIQTNLPTLIWHSLTSVYRQASVTSFAIVIILALTWLIGSALFNTNLRQFGFTLGLSLIVWFIFTLYQAALLVYISNQTKTDPSTLTSLPVFINLLPGFVLWLIALLLAVAISQSVRQPQVAASPIQRWLSTTALFIGILLLALFTNLQPIQGDMVTNIANTFSTRKDYANAIPLYRQAIGFSPVEDHYFLLLAQAQINQAQTISDRTQRINQYKIAIRNLNTAQHLNPLLPSTLISLAQTNQLIAQIASSAEATTSANTANTYYAQALRLAPNNAEYWNSWARMSLKLRGDKTAALQQIQSSLAIDSQYGPTYALFGDYWSILGNTESDDTIQQSEYQRAATNYQQAIQLQPNAALLANRLSLGQVETALKHYDEAIKTFNDLLERSPDADNVWVVYNSLAKVYLAKGDKIKALENAFLALNFAPDRSSKDQVQAFINQVK